MLESLKILFHQGKQYIPDVTTTDVPGIFRGRPIISTETVDTQALVEMCPTEAITANDKVAIDLGRCTFCGECAHAFPNKIRFTKDYKLACNTRSGIIVTEGNDTPITVDADKIRKEVRRLFGRSIKLREVSAGGDGSCEWELNATSNVNFDIGRFGIDFVASPRHADGLVITGPITANMAESLRTAYNAMPDPKIVVLAGTDAISGGIFEGSPALNRAILDEWHIDLFIPGNPVHPLTFVNAMLGLLGKKNR